MPDALLRGIMARWEEFQREPDAALLPGLERGLDAIAAQLSSLRTFLELGTPVPDRPRGAAAPATPPASAARPGVSDATPSVVDPEPAIAGPGKPNARPGRDGEAGPDRDAEARAHRAPEAGPSREEAAVPPRPPGRSPPLDKLNDLMEAIAATWQGIQRAPSSRRLRELEEELLWTLAAMETVRGERKRGEAPGEAPGGSERRTESERSSEGPGGRERRGKGDVRPPERREGAPPPDAGDERAGRAAPGTSEGPGEAARSEGGAGPGRPGDPPPAAQRLLSPSDPGTTVATEPGAPPAAGPRGGGRGPGEAEPRGPTGPPGDGVQAGALPPGNGATAAADRIQALDSILFRMLSDWQHYRREPTSERIGVLRGELDHALRQVVSLRSALPGISGPHERRTVHPDVVAPALVFPPFRDQTTGLHSREGFDTAARGELKRCRRHERPFSLLILQAPYRDVSQMRDAASALRGTLRESDLIGRHMDRTLAIALPETPMADARGVARRVVAALESVNAWKRDGRLGLSSYPRDGDTLLTLVEAATRQLVRPVEDILGPGGTARG